MTIDLIPERTALLAVDLQNYFLDPRYLAGHRYDPGLLQTVNRLAAAIRSAGGLVVWIQTDASPASCGDWTAYRARSGEAAWQRRTAELSLGTAGAELHPELQVDDRDLRFIKSRFSAFIKAPVDLDALLRDRGIDTVLIAGVTTETCCESTARDAMMLNYHVAVVDDAVAAHSPAVHEASLSVLCPRFAERMNTTDVITHLAGTR